MMEHLKLAQFNNYHIQSSKKKIEILKKVDVKYCIPDTIILEKLKRYSGYTSLHFAVQSYIVDQDMCLDLINELIKQGSNLVNQSTRDGYSPIHMAYNILDISKCELLLSKQVEMQNISNPKSSDGMSHLHIACAINHVAAVEFLARFEGNVNQHINCDASKWPGYAPLHCAVEHFCVEAAEILLQHGADVDLKNANGMSSVQLLVNRCLEPIDSIVMGELFMLYEQKLERIESIIKLVLKARVGDGILIDDTGFTALHLACMMKDQSIVADFLKQNIDVNLPVKSEFKFWPGWTPLHFAACSNVETVILLMQHGADITMKNSNGETALDLCAEGFAIYDIQAILSTKKEFRDIVMSDGCNKLLDLLSAINDYEKFSDYLAKLKDVNITVPSNSAIWPGYNLLHLSVILNRKPEYRMLLNGSLDAEQSERYNCTKDEKALYCKRIELLLKYGCSTSTKNVDGQTPIHLGFGTSSEAALKKLLASDKDNSVDQNGMSHLHIACALGQLDTVKRYVDGGANVNGRTRVACSWHSVLRGKRLEIVENSTPLHVAMIYGYKNVVQYLLANNAEIYATDSLGFTPIHLAVSEYDNNLTRLLLDAVAANLRDSVSPIGLSHLHVAVWAEHCEAVKRLLLSGADIDGVVDTDRERYPFLEWCAGKTPLHLALEDDRIRTFVILLKAGANIHAKNLKGESVLQRALFHQPRCSSSQHLIRVLKESRESHDVESDGMTLLHVACVSLDVEWAGKLLEQGTDVDAQIRGGRLDGATPLFLVFYEIQLNRHEPVYNPRRRYALAELLIDSGADVTIASCGRTPLHLFYKSLRVDGHFRFPSDEDELFLFHAVDLLLRSQKSYRVNPVDESGFSHFHFACVRNDVEIATKFLDHVADVNGSIDPFDTRSGGFTPLHFAMAYKSTAVAYLLLQRGADVNAEDADGNTPLHVAFDRRFVNLPLIEAMIKLGADVHVKNLKDYTLLHCLVEILDSLTSGEYLNIIERTDIDSCLYQRDVDDNTPLHLAIKCKNPGAIEAIFCIGVDINLLDIEKEFHMDKISRAIMQREMNVTTELACHIWKIRFIRLDLTNENLRFLESMENRFLRFTLLEQRCQDELTKAIKTEICEGVTVNHFLSELGAAAAYPIMYSIQRAAVDRYFKRIVDLYREFPEFCGLLLLQYRKALDRLELMQPAKEAIASILQVELPDLCSEAVLRYFAHSEMKIVIEVVKGLFV